MALFDPRKWWEYRERPFVEALRFRAGQLVRIFVWVGGATVSMWLLVALFNGAVAALPNPVVVRIPDFSIHPAVCILAAMLLAGAVYVVLLGCVEHWFIDVPDLDREAVIRGNQVASPLQGRMECTQSSTIGNGTSSTKSSSLSPSTSWKQFASTHHSDLLGRALCVGSAKPSSRMGSLARQMASSKYSVDLVGDLVTALEVVLIKPDYWRLIIVDVDYVERYQDLDEIVDQLFCFRSGCNSVAVILMSYGFGTDDSNLSRSAISDYSFRSTVSDEKVIATLSEVFRNHKENMRRALPTGVQGQSVVPFKKRGDR